MPQFNAPGRRRPGANAAPHAPIDIAGQQVTTREVDVSAYCLPSDVTACQALASIDPALILHPDDARAKLVSLTKEGRRLQRKLWKESETLRRRLWECLPLEDRSIVTDGLRRIAAEMEQFKADFDGSR